jgi:hypothetical protein
MSASSVAPTTPQASSALRDGETSLVGVVKQAARQVGGGRILPRGSHC